MSRIFLNHLSFYKKQHKKRNFKKTYLFKNYMLKNISYSRYIHTGSMVLVLVTREFILPRRFIFNFRKNFKKFFKKKIILCHTCFQINYILTSKHKNSRMGKGVGSFNRFVIRCYRGRPIFLIKNVNKRRIDSLLIELSKDISGSFKTYNIRSRSLYYKSNFNYDFLYKYKV